MNNFKDFLIEQHPEFLAEGWKSTLGGMALGAAGLGAALGGHNYLSNGPNDSKKSQQASQQSEYDIQDIRAMFDNFSRSGNKMTPQQWQQLAHKYGKPNSVGFVPNPAKPGQWIPGGGADSVRVQSRTQINNDELTSDEISLTPYKNGQAIGPTNVSDFAK